MPTHKADLVYKSVHLWSRHCFVDYGRYVQMIDLSIRYVIGREKCLDQLDQT